MSSLDDLMPGRNEAMRRYQAEARKAEQALVALVTFWAATDPDFEDKVPLLHDYGSVLAKQLLAGEVHPSEVIGLMQNHYNEITITRAMQANAGETRTVH